MKKVPFNVSARTARLIGRENVSSAEGALIELVKNSYDADATYCIVYFEDSFAELPNSLTNEKLQEFVEITGEPRLFKCYEKQLFDEDLLFSQKEYYRILKKSERRSLEESLLQTVSIYIIDDGEGMEENTIEESWMTIGTDNKFENFISEKQRIKSGAKGIGRFALDRLGAQCNLSTRTEISDQSLVWSVNWDDFDKPGATIDQVSATLSYENTSISAQLNEIKKYNDDASKIPCENHGTTIKISSVRDSWTKDNIEKIFLELESLAPPTEASGFSIYLYSKLHKYNFGEVRSSICDDYDYKYDVEVCASGNVNFKIHRHEADISKLTPELLDRSYFKEKEINSDLMNNSVQNYTKNLSELIPGLSELDEEISKSIGSFNFVFYFLKRQSEKNDIATFLHRDYDSNARKKWLDHNSGIRIYRDNFRVRPYGEIGKASWDWLGLATRHAEDPSSLRSGRWRVTPNNISGIINISRINNLGLEDKSSREGMRENNSFLLFKKIIEVVIKEFENDRSGTYSEVYKYTESLRNTPTEKDINPVQEADAEILAQRIFEEIKTETLSKTNDSSKLAVALLKAKAHTREIDDQLVEMKRENSLLRVFASSGLTIAAFTHELDGLNAKLGGRFDHLSEMFLNFIKMNIEERAIIPQFKDPFRRLDLLKRDDEKIKNWIKYSLRTIRKDKRNRKKIDIESYLHMLQEEWNSTLIDRQIDITFSVSSTDIYLTAYEIDLDCIFNNLIVNSTEAFKRTGFSGIRKIFISAMDRVESIEFIYRDSGPGLSPDITNPNDIFKATYSTKINKNGIQIGTGLGMWLVKKTVEEYNGKVSIIEENGFGIKMEIKK